MVTRYQKKDLFQNQQELQRPEKLIREEIRKKIHTQIITKPTKQRMKFFKKF